MARKLATALLAFAMLAGLAGCSLLFPPPPTELVAAAKKYAEDVRALPGVKALEAATGTSIYMTSQRRAVVELTIRGMSEGITISAMGECRG